MFKKVIFLLLILSLVLASFTMLAACKEEEPTPPGGSVTPPAGNNGEEETVELFDWDFFTDDAAQRRAKLTEEECNALVEQNLLRWEIYDDGTLYLKGIAVIAPTFTSAADQPWRQFSQLEQEDSGLWKPRVKKLVVEATVMALPAYAFQGCTDLVSVTLPSTMSKLPEYCFTGCESLTTVTGCMGLAEIGEHAFSGCSLLNRLEVSVNLASVGYAAFDRACNGIGSTGLTLQIRGTEADWNASKEAMTVDAVGTAAFREAKTVFIT